MKISEALSRSDNANPNSVDTSTKIQWLSELDGLIKSEIFDNYKRNDTEPDVSDFSGYTNSTPVTTELLVPFPYDDIYVNYLIAQVYLVMGESSKYNNYAEIFDTERETYENFYARTHQPKGPYQFTFY